MLLFSISIQDKKLSGFNQNFSRVIWKSYMKWNERIFFFEDTAAFEEAFGL